VAFFEPKLKLSQLFVKNCASSKKKRLPHGCPTPNTHLSCVANNEVLKSEGKLKANGKSLFFAKKELRNIFWTGGIKLKTAR